MGGRRVVPEPPAPPPEQILASSEPEEMGLNPEELGPPPGDGEDRHRVADTAAPVVEEVELSPEEQVMFASLLTCGRRSKTLALLDHSVVVQTLCGDDDLRIGLYVQKYQGTLGEQRAYQIGVVAAGIRTINGKPLIQTLYEGAGNDVLFDQKCKKVAEMYPTVINRIYRAVMDAETEFVKLAVRLGLDQGK
jgi:hypothetical protein